MFKTYRKTATIKAEQYDGSIEIIERYGLLAPNKESLFSHDDFLVNPIYAVIKTEEGLMHLKIGDWIATGIDGEHWAISDDIFKKTYEEVEDDE